MADVMMYFDAAAWIDIFHSHTLVMACSDPRFRKSIENFVEQHLRLHRFDPLFLPGGPATILTSHRPFFLVRNQIQFLHGLHSFKRIIGVAHRHCGYYRARYKTYTEEEIYEKQWDDLLLFRREISHLVWGVEAECYFADPHDGGIRFLARTE